MSKRDLRIKIVEALEPKKRFNLYWQDIQNCSSTIEAASEEDAREKFHNGGIDWANVDYGDVDYEDGSLEIEETKE
jgi:hypothetical protein